VIDVWVGVLVVWEFEEGVYDRFLVLVRILVRCMVWMLVCNCLSLLLMCMRYDVFFVVMIFVWVVSMVFILLVSIVVEVSVFFIVNVLLNL